jgi:hypothetical protein
MSNLESAVRGDTFRYSFTLSSTWLGSSFTGGVKFTMRLSKPATATVTDADAFHVASVANGEITFVGAVGTITIPASVTTTWEPRSYYWDLQGVVSGTVPTVHTIDSGQIAVTPDVGRGLT